MNFTIPTVSIISADPAVAQICVDELAALGGRYRTLVSNSIDQALNGFHNKRPVVMFLDESAMEACGESLEAVISHLIETAPVVLAASPEKKVHFEFLISSGAMDFVARDNHFPPIAAGLLDRRARIAEGTTGIIPFPAAEMPGDFGEILRHEVNNPLTGILGNTELLLARSESLPPGAIERLQTIAELAVRLRETVRRLSNVWDEHHEPVRHA